MGFWSSLGKLGLMAAPIAAAPFTGGASLAAITAGAGAGSSLLNRKSGAGAGAGGGNMATTPAAGGQGGGGFWGTWGPVIAQGAGLGVGAWAGKKATSSAMQRSPEEQLALRGATDVAEQARQLGGQLFKEGKPYIQQPANYYQTLLSGNRAAMQQAVSPAVAQITGNYRGAGRALQHSGVRGAARDVAAGELNRQRASQIAGLTTGVQPYAAEQLAGLGQNLMAQAPGLIGAAGNIYGGLLGEGYKNRVYGREEGGKLGTAIGGFARDIGETVFNKGTKYPVPVPQTPGPKVPIRAGLPSGLPGGTSVPPFFPTAGQQAGLRFPGTVAPWLGTGQQEAGAPDWWKTARF